MKKKKIIIDLSILRDLNCGLGQIALNYGKYFRDSYSGDDFDICLLLPEEFVGVFGDKVTYKVSNKLNKHVPYFMRRFDGWHAIHQLSRFYPFYRSTKYLLTIHDFNFVYEKTEKKRGKYFRRIQKRVNRANKIVAISQFTKGETARYMNLHGKPVDVVLNAVEQLNVLEEKQPAFSLDNNDPFFFTLGQINKKKNFHVLLGMMKLFPEKTLYIAGRDDTDYAQMIRETLQTENISNVHLVGPISHEEKIWLYNHCEAFLFPSLFEGFGLPVIEAMSFGKPVFSSKETSLKEVGGDCAFFWDDFEPEHMKMVIDNNLANFYANPALAQKNIDYAKSFSYKDHIETYFNIYRSLFKK
jgi:glycosyltransferase involved in cell wall biosynthesis